MATSSIQWQHHRSSALVDDLGNDRLVPRWARLRDERSSLSVKNPAILHGTRQQARSS